MSHKDVRSQQAKMDMLPRFRRRPLSLRDRHLQTSGVVGRAHEVSLSPRAPAHDQCVTKPCGPNEDAESPNGHAGVEVLDPLFQVDLEVRNQAEQEQDDSDDVLHDEELI